MASLTSLLRLKRTLLRRELALKGELRANRREATSVFQATKARPSLWHKLKTLLLQIAFLKKKERDLLSEIIAVEKKHRTLRAKRKLRCLCTTETPEAFSPRPKRRKENDFWFGFVMAYIYRKFVEDLDRPHPR